MAIWNDPLMVLISFSLERATKNVGYRNLKNIFRWVEEEYSIKLSNNEDIIMRFNGLEIWNMCVDDDKQM